MFQFQCKYIIVSILRIVFLDVTSNSWAHAIIYLKALNFENYF